MHGKSLSGLARKLNSTGWSRIRPTRELKDPSSGFRNMICCLNEESSNLSRASKLLVGIMQQAMYDSLGEGRHLLTMLVHAQ